MKYFKNTSWLFAERVMRMVVGLFVGVWVARYLGPKQLGLLSYAQSFVGLFSAIATLGLNSIAVKELVNNRDRKDILIATVFWLKIVGAILVLALLAIAIKFTSNDSITNTLVFIIASATVFQSFNIVDIYFQSKVLSKYSVYANLISLFFSSVVKVFLIINEAPLIAFAWVIFFDSFVLALGFIYFFFKKSSIKIKKMTFDRGVAISLLRESWPLIFVGIASMINMRMDQVFLGNMASSEIVGNYSVAVRIAEIWLILPMLIGSSIFPAIISAKEHSLSLYRRRIFATVKYMAIFAIPFAIIISLLSEYIMNLLYGTVYSESGLYLALYIWTGLPYVVLFVLSQIIIIEKLTHWNIYITLFSVTGNIVLNIILIPIYGGVGAIAATLVVTYLSQCILLYIIYHKTQLFKG